MPEAIAALAQETVDLIIHAGNPSRGSIATLMAVAANPAGHINIGQVSPTRRLSDFQKKYRKGTITEIESRMATASRLRYPRHAVNVTPDRTTGSRMNPTSPNCRPMKSPTVRNENSWVAVARTNWNLNDAQSCPAFQTNTGRNKKTAISAAAHGYGLISQRRRQPGTSMKAATAGTSITAVNFDSSASPANTPAASHQRASSLSLSRINAHTIATANGISATSGETLRSEE